MKRVYIAHALRGDVAGNLARVRAVARDVALRGGCPVYSHELAHVLDDGDDAERAIGLRCGLALLEACDEVLVAGPVSEGMRAEIAAASELGIPITFHTEENHP